MADPHSLEAVLMWLYRNEINASVSSFWDSGFSVMLGDDRNGYVDQASFYDLAEAACWLRRKAFEHYPGLRLAARAALDNG